MRSDRREYFENLLRSAHGSVLEHASYSFALRNVSRVFTHELVRHRAGSAFSQESLRYVRLTDIGFRVPPALEPVRERVLAIVERSRSSSATPPQTLGLDDEGVPFHVKKEVTSALRRLAPIGLSTDIVWSANLRTLRHVIEMRTAEGAEEELRSVFDEIARVMLREAPRLPGLRARRRRLLGAALSQGLTPPPGTARRRAPHRRESWWRAIGRRGRTPRAPSSPRRPLSLSGGACASWTPTARARAAPPAPGREG